MSYRTDFFEEHAVTLPVINDTERAKFSDAHLTIADYLLPYQNYSVLQNPFRGFPYYTATNINGTLFQSLKREDIFIGSERWQKDERISADFQWGNELYSAKKNDFDRGHMTKREDVQWGNSLETARIAAQSTFHFTNAVPQVARLNRGIWRRIENYILHHETVRNSMKISLFTGPAFREDDPEFVEKIANQIVRLPYLFWKVVYYVHNAKLHRAAFLTSQLRLLQKNRIVKPRVRAAEAVRSVHFNKFKDAETYQVTVSFIEKMSGLKFAEAIETFKSDTPEKLILSRVNVRNAEMANPNVLKTAAAALNIKL